jgi:serine/threonine protein kinase
MPFDTCTRPHSPTLVGETLFENLAEQFPTCLQHAPRELIGSVAECPSEDDVLSFTNGQLDAAHVLGIDEHLARCSSCSRVVTDLLSELAAPSGTHPMLVPCMFPPATQVAGRFSIERLIGRGGMGEVYAAVDQRHGRTVALKTVLATHCDSRRAMMRLVAELRATRRIRHPNVCRARGMGMHTHDAANGMCCRFIVMDYIEGETLGQRTRREGVLPLPEALRVGRQILLGLEASHAAGVVHLDVKSDNVMLRAGSESRAVLIDFGLACTTPAGTFQPRPQGSPRGTPSYMAPEQILNQPVSPHMDVFGFGVVMFELLTGQHPFRSRQRSPIGPSELLETRALRAEELPLHPALTLGSLSKRLDDFVAACTEADPHHRIPNAATALAHFDSLGS